MGESGVILSLGYGDAPILSALPTPSLALETERPKGIAERSAFHQETLGQTVLFLAAVVYIMRKL